MKKRKRKIEEEEEDAKVKSKTESTSRVISMQMGSKCLGVAGYGLTYIGLEAREEIDEEWMARGIGHLEDALLGQKRLDLVAGDDIALFQRFNGKVLASVAILCQDDLFGGRKRKKQHEHANSTSTVRSGSFQSDFIRAKEYKKRNTSATVESPYFAEMAAPEDADKAEVVQRNAAGELRGASRFVCAVAVVERPARTSHRREYLQSNKKKTTQISSFSFGHRRTLQLHGLSCGR